MADSTAEFFSELTRRQHQPSLEWTTGTLRFDLEEGEETDHWLVAVDKGAVTVSHSGAPADCVVRGKKGLFDDVASGDLNLTAARLRGELSVEGDVRLLITFQRLFGGRRMP